MADSRTAWRLPVVTRTRSSVGTTLPPHGSGTNVRAAGTRRKTLFGVINFLFVFVVLTATLSGADAPAAYLILLFLLCTLPLAFGGAPHGRFVILLIFMPLLFLHFGFTDLMALFSTRDTPRLGSSGGLILSSAEVVILAGIAMLVLGYRAASTALRRQPGRFLADDWRMSSVMMLGLTGWALGIVGTWIFQLTVADLHSSARYGWSAHTGLVFLNMLQHLGIVLLIYAAVVHKGKLPMAVMIGVMAINFFVGFIGDSKEIAIQPLVMLIAGMFLLRGRVPKVWLIAACIVVVATYSVFMGYRDVLHASGLSREKALDNISQNLNKALRSSTSGTGRIDNSIREFTARVNLKPMVEIIVARTGRTVPYQEGKTLAIVLYTFIPRIFIDKPDTSIGRLVNKEFRISESPETYISASQLGELYWNFGWPGVIIGMFVIGGILGAVGTLFNLAEKPTVSRLLVVLITIYVLCLRFEGGFGLQYTLWLRYLLIILLAHWIFSKKNHHAAPLAKSGAVYRTQTCCTETETPAPVARLKPHRF